MKLYKSPDGEVFAYELDGSQDHLIPDDFVPLTKEEIDAREQEVVANEMAYKARKEAETAARQSALEKLMKLGLTEEEALALGVK